jgi:predicted alpha/beta-hydrolase family hydrolase
VSDPLVTEYEYQGPTERAIQAVLLAHGAGADMNARPLVAVAEALAKAGVGSLRFNYPYKTAGRRAPDRQEKLIAATDEAIDKLEQRSGLPRERLVIGGRSMGGRMCTHLAALPDAYDMFGGLLLLGYPLKPAGKPGPIRDEHFSQIEIPVLFVSGTRDALAPKAELTKSARRLRGPVTFHWLATVDHGVRPLKSSGRTVEEVLAEVAETSVTWVKGLAA